MRSRGACLLVVLCLYGLFSGAVQAAENRVAVGYVPTYTPWVAGIGSGGFERATGYDIDWIAFDSSLDALAALSKDRVQIAYAGVTPAARAASAGLPFEVFWVVAGIGHSEALVVRNGAGITNPQDLHGKRIAATFASTAHYHLLFALEQFGMSAGDVRFVALKPGGILSAWNQGRIDAAFVREPILGRFLESGRPLIHAADLGSWGRPTFDSFVADPDWAAANPDFMISFVRTIAALDGNFKNAAEEWGPDSVRIDDLVSIVGGTPQRAVRALHQYRLPSIRQQVSPTWLSGGAQSGVARALADNADFLVDQGILREAASDYARHVNEVWVRRARQTR